MAPVNESFKKQSHTRQCHPTPSEHFDTPDEGVNTSELLVADAAAGSMISVEPSLLSKSTLLERDFKKARFDPLQCVSIIHKD